MEYQVRAARITDVERIVALGATDRAAPQGAGRTGATELLRQLVYLPQASVLVAEFRRQVVGGAVLALRPSVSLGGNVGTVDLLVVEQGTDSEAIADVLIEEILRSARNKGCAVVEAALPGEPAERTRWSRHHFLPAGPRLEHPVMDGRAGTNRT